MDGGHLGPGGCGERSRSDCLRVPERAIVLFPGTILPQLRRKARLERLWEKENVRAIEDPLENAVELASAKIFACSMAMDALDIREDDLKFDIGEPIGLSIPLGDATVSQV